MSTPGAGGTPPSCCWHTSSPPDPVPACPALPFRYLALSFASPAPFAASAAPLRVPRGSGGRGAAAVPLSRSGPERGGCSAGTMYGLSLLSFPLRKRGPRNRGGAVATKRTSAQRVFRRHGARALLKSQPPPCLGALGGSMSFWLPSSARWSLDPGVRRENEG